MCALVALLIVLLAIGVQPSPAAKSTNSQPIRGSRPPHGAQQSDADVVRIRLAALQQQRTPLSDATRNPFHFRRVSNAIAPQQPAPITPSTPALPPPAPVRTNPTPPIALKFIGTLQRADGTVVAVLSDGTSYPTFGTPGQIVLGRYRIVSIGQESIEMSHIDGRGRQVIRMTGQ